MESNSNPLTSIVERIMLTDNQTMHQGDVSISYSEDEI